MRVLHVHSGNMYGGVERVLETIALQSHACPSMRSSYALCFEGRLASALEAAGATVMRLGAVRASRPWTIKHARRLLAGALAAAPHDVAVVHSDWSQALLGPTLSGANLPIVRWLHAPDPGPWWLDAAAQRVRPALVICNSQYTRAAARGRLGNLATAVQYYPVQMLDSDGKNRDSVRDALQTTSDTCVIAIAARMEQWKGHRLLLDALTDLPASGWEAWIIGGPQVPGEQPYFDHLRQRATRPPLKDRVRFLGQQTDVGRLLWAADLYCQPNEGPEPFGLSFVEALSARLPVVTTRLGALPEIVDDSCGMLVEPGSAAALTKALRSLISDAARRLEMAAAARRRAATFCDVPRSLADFSALLAPICAGQAASA